MENTKNMMIPVVLKGPNYLLWSRTARMILCSKGMWRHIISSQPTEEDDGDSEGGMMLAEDSKWFQEDQMVLAILTSSLDAHLIESYSFCDTAKELWDTLKKVFGNVSNLTRVYEVKKAINTLSQDEMDFSAYFGKLSSLWAELEMLRPGTSDPSVIKERQEQDKVFKLLGGLNGNFNDLTKHILRQERVPSVDEVCSQILKEQGTHDLVSKGELIMANQAAQVEHASAHKAALTYEERRRLVCDHCKRKGHSKDSCWVLHPHLKPNKFKDQRANLSQLANKGDQAGTSKPSEIPAVKAGPEDDIMRKSDVEKLLKSIASLKDFGITYFSQKPVESLVVDSGASHHMISNPRLIENIEPAIGNVVVANGTRVPIRGVGDLKLFDKTSKAFYMPKFTSNLLSVKRATTDLDCLAIFGSNSVHFQDTKSGKILGEGGTKDGLYVIGDVSSSSLDTPPFVTSNVAVALNSVWHARLGHPHARAFELMLPNIKFDHAVCEACILGKHCKTVFPNSSTTYDHCFDLIHSDVWTSPCVSRDNLKYFVTFIDERSKYTWITLLPSKDRVFDAFLNFQNYVTNQFNAKIKVLRSDNGGEYTSIKFKEHLAKYGIIHQTSCPYTPQQNGVAERKNRHLMEVARSMMFHAKVPRRFWGDAVMTACYLINRTPTRVLKDRSPFEVLNGLKPSLDHLKVFGCVCFVLVPGELRNKLDPKSNRCMFIGYSTSQKGYKCIDPNTGKTYVSRDVRFLEEQGYFDKVKWEDLEDLAHSTSDRSASLRHLLEQLGLGRETNTPSTPGLEVPQDNESPSEPREVPHKESEEADPVKDPVMDEEADSDLQGDEEAVPAIEATPHQAESEGETATAPPLRRSTRLRKDPSNWINTRVYYNNQAVAHPIQASCSITLLPSDHQAFLGKIEMHTIPKTYEEAREIKEWCEAIGAEVNAMEKNHTWEEADLPNGKKAVSSKWVFTIKYRSNGDIERYKARLVARGFTQTYGEDYTDTFAPVAKLHTVRVVLSLATNLSWELWQMDVKNAFLQGELEDEVYMYPPPGLENSIAPGKVLKLRKAIYGLKQSPRAWYHKLSSTLKSRGFRKSEADHTLFTSQSPRGIIVVLVYVDDLIISGNDTSGIAETKAFLKSVFDIKDLGELKYFLGIEVCRSTEGLLLSQRKYVLDLLTETGKLGAKPAKTPLEDGYKVARKGEKDDTPYKDPAQYRRLVGKLIYLTITRPDLCFAVNQVSQHMQTPSVYHWNMVERILRYLKGSPGRGIWMGRNENTEIVGYCDADWAGDRNDRKSTTGYCTFIGGNLVTWKTKKQKVVSCSSAEAEYRAMRKLTNELTWLKALLKDLGIESSKPIIMHCDNQAAIHIASNSVFHERTKHIEIDCHKVREKIEEGVTLPCYTKSEDQLADIFTKAASLKVCDHINNKLGLVDSTRP